MNVLCGPKVEYAEGLIVCALTGRGPRSPGSIEFLFLIWTGYFNLGSSWLSKERDREQWDTQMHMNDTKTEGRFNQTVKDNIFLSLWLEAQKQLWHDTTPQSSHEELNPNKDWTKCETDRPPGVTKRSWNINTDHCPTFLPSSSET